MQVCCIWTPAPPCTLPIDKRTVPVASIHLKEELDGVLVELEGNGLEQRHEVREDLLIPQIVAQPDDVVQVVVREQEEHGRLLADVGDKNAQRLQHKRAWCEPGQYAVY